MTQANAKWAAICVAIVTGMAGLAWASVPAYRLICQQFGFGGTPKIGAGMADAPPAVAAERTMTVRFNAETAKGLKWTFKPAQLSMTLPVGATGLAYYDAINDGDRPVTGTATFNVTPLQAAKYFVKTECFCFTEQTLAAGDQASMPVSFFIDEAILDDAALAELNTVTLSYTFFETPESRAAAHRSAAVDAGGLQESN